MKKRFTITSGPDAQKALVKIARKLSIETNTGWDSQEVLERLINIGLTHTMTAYFPGAKAVSIRD